MTLPTLEEANKALNEGIIQARQPEENNPSPLALMPVMNTTAARARRNAIIDFTREIMIEGTDFGKIPGTERNTLLKPGAEKLTTHFGLTPRFLVMKETLDWTGDDHGGEPFFYFQYMCQLFKGDYLVGEGVGSCNSWEKKYRFRKGARICPNCQQEAIIKSKQEYGGGWLCFHKKGGCGAKWPDGEAAIEDQNVEQVLNDNPQDLVNTIDKISQKRSLVAVTLTTVNASEFFTQDLENGEIINGEITDPVTETKTETQPGTAPKSGSLDAEAITAFKLTATKNPTKIQATQFWIVAKHFGVDSEEGQAIYKELGNWADALLYVIDKFSDR